MFNKLKKKKKERMNKVRTSIANRKYKKAPNWSDPADKYNNWTKKHTGEVQQQTRWGRRLISKVTQTKH